MPAESQPLTLCSHSLMTISFHTPKEELTSYLHQQQFIPTTDHVMAIEKPGEGNMNFVARIITTKTSLILKQANPFVQKYPHIAAPIERLLVEARFYQTIQHSKDLAASMPALLGVDIDNYILVLQNFNPAFDYTFLYRKNNFLTDAELSEAVDFLNQLHQLPLTKLEGYPTNLSLRQLNHEHLFHYPLMLDNGFDLNSIQLGLQDIALRYKTDKNLKFRIEKLGEIYLSTDISLLHGDYYPGSWLKTEAGFKVIDPEFSFVGSREFEVGILLAHLKMTEAPIHHLTNLSKEYLANRRFNWNLCYQFAGVEIMRRIIGLAQLPFDLSLHEKEVLLNEAYFYIMKSR